MQRLLCFFGVHIEIIDVHGVLTKRKVPCKVCIVCGKVTPIKKEK